MEEKKDYSQCIKCKYFIEDDKTLKTAISYCIILGINTDNSGRCSDFAKLNMDEINLSSTEADPVL